MDVTTEVVGAVNVVHIAGRLDNKSSEVFDARLRELLGAGHTRLVLDLAQVSYVSSAGLRSLLIVAKQLKILDGAFVLAAVRPPVWDVLEICGLTKMFASAPTAEEAVATIQPDR